MRKISSQDFLNTVAQGLNCRIYSYSKKGFLLRATGTSQYNLDFLPAFINDAKTKFLLNQHITINSEELSLDNKHFLLHEVFVPLTELEKGFGLLWLFIKEKDQQGKKTESHILSEDKLRLLQTLSHIYKVLITTEDMREEISLYRQLLNFTSNMLANSLILYDKKENILFYNNAAKKMGITKNNFKKVLDVNTKDFYQGNKLLGKIKYTSAHKELLGHYNNTIKNFNKIIGKDPQTDKIVTIIKQVAATDTTVLLRGESGTGKEEYAKLIHNLSPRQNEPFVALNCAAIPENLLESELFGYEGGSFTGAKKEGNIGKFQLAHNGTIFLDEIGDMPLTLQVKLLRFLQERYVEPVGSNKKIPIDVRIICATHQNLEEQIQLGEFREDLFYRINVIPITIPSLHYRKDDIELLITYYVKKFCLLQKKDFMTFSYESMNTLKNYNWPGNVRELMNVVEYCVTMTNKSVISNNDLPTYMQSERKFNQINTEITSPPHIKQMKPNKTGKPSPQELLILLDKFGRGTEDKKKLAQHLNISLATLYRWLAKIN